MDLRGGDASLSHQLLRLIGRQKLLDVPESDRSVLHTTSNDA